MEQQQHFYEFEKLFWQLSRNMGYLWKKIYAQSFPGSQSHILFTLERSGPKKMSELASILYLTPGAVTTASDRLIENGYIARVRDEEDRRVVHLELTTKGADALQSLQNEGRQIMKKVFHDISDDDLKTINNVFEHAMINIDSVGRDFD